MINPIVIDFETEAVENRPSYPPEPVGVAIRWQDGRAVYYAWGHPYDDNNFSKDAARYLLQDVLRSSAPLLFHNAKFDLAVIEEKLGLRLPSWDRVHDTMFLAYLADPHSRSIGLKELAEDLLDWAPEERDEVGDWLYERRAELMARFGGKLTRAKYGPTSTGAWISKAPAELVGRYAVGDVERTCALFQHLYPLILENDMGPAYDRERRLLPILMQNERVGMRVDEHGLRTDVQTYCAARARADQWLRKRLKAPELNVDSDEEFAEALAQAGVIDDDKWTFTKTGKRSVAKGNLKPSMYNDPQVAAAFGYRNRLNTCLAMFMQPWLAQAEARYGYISTNWNQTRGGDGGTRTGRPSTNNPNFLNISKSFEGRTDGYEHPAHLGVPELPLVRKYILPDHDALFLHRDFDGQELRIFGHYECGELYEAYLRDPRLDVHDMVGTKMKELSSIEYERTRVKVINFQSIYGGGIPALCAALDIAVSQAKEFKAFHDQALPGRKILNEEIKRLTSRGEPIRTWGGRMYFPEPPRLIDGRMRDFVYKLLNYLVQGSAADATKEAIIRWHDHPKRDAEDRFLVTVYDEINISGPRRRAVEAMRVLKECMEGLEFDVQMLSAAKAGASWGTCQKPNKGETEDDFIRRLAA